MTICVCSCAQLNAVEYTLEDLYKIALQRSEIIKISEEDLFISEKGKDKAMSLLIPKVSGTGSYTGYKDQKTSDTGSLTQPSEATSWSLRLDQSLSTSGREITAFKMAKDNIEKSRQELFSTREAYAMHVANVYYDVLKAGKIVEISQQNIERLKKYRNVASTRLKLGEVTKTALLRAEAELSGAQSDLIKAKNVFKSTKTVLQRTVGLDEEFAIYDIYKSGLSGLRNISEGNEDPLILNCSSLNVECLRDILYSSCQAQNKDSIIPMPER